jgi:hypothetical protein
VLGGRGQGASAGVSANCGKDRLIPKRVRALADESQRAAQLKIGVAAIGERAGEEPDPAGEAIVELGTVAGIARRAVGVAGLACRPTFGGLRDIPHQRLIWRWALPIG